MEMCYLLFLNPSVNRFNHNTLPPKTWLISGHILAYQKLWNQNWEIVRVQIIYHFKSEFIVQHDASVVMDEPDFLQSQPIKVWDLSDYRYSKASSLTASHNERSFVNFTPIC